MGNHFRTSGAGDDAPKTQAGVQGSRFATPDSEGQPVAQAPAQPADQAQPASDPFAYNPTSDVALSGTAGFEPVGVAACPPEVAKTKANARSFNGAAARGFNLVMLSISVVAL